MSLFFDPGPCSIRPGAKAALEAAGEISQALIIKHTHGDFGTAGLYHEILPTITEEEYREGSMATSDDGKLNVIALKNMFGRVMSYYEFGSTKIWVCTDGLGTPDLCTTILLPSEY